MSTGKLGKAAERVYRARQGSTPGPWLVGERTAEIVNVEDAHSADPETTEIVTVRAGLDEIAYVPSADEANARLIAAAPELLTFAANAENTIAQYLAGHEVTGFARLLDEAHALLARVQGEG